MNEKTSKMVPKNHYDQMEKATRLKLRNEFLKRSGMSLITFYVNPEKPDVPLNKNDAFQKVQKRRVQEKR